MQIENNGFFLARGEAGYQKKDVYIPESVAKYGRNLFDTTDKAVVTVYGVDGSVAEKLSIINEVNFKEFDFSTSDKYAPDAEVTVSTEE